MSSHVGSAASSQVGAKAEEQHKQKTMDLPGVFPMPIILSPLLQHIHTFIILHGRGSTAEQFSTPLLETTTASGESLRTAFPHAKLIFLTASRNRATIYKKSYTHQWFDHWHMDGQNKRQDLIAPGLYKSCNYVHGILQQEIESVGKENVVLWGLSQGCATSLTSTLTWNGEPFAATIGMCGYLPYVNHLTHIIKKDDSESDFDPFCSSDTDDDVAVSGDKGPQDRQTQAVQYLRDEIEMEGPAQMVFRDTAIFLGHGTEDEKVSIEIGREARVCLDLMGADVTMVEYEGLGHWYSSEMLGDIFRFLRENLRIQNS
ncbi:acyl-protein thioesterase [Phlyctema vagabunda]|uniref:Acyl-protein thioesterase n=1 Tax=Phlyctema vagabunda TaxID=108571 RepID=A0ABR4PDX9_9HELO